MTEPLFREEAVEHVRRGRGTGDVVRVAPRWTEVALWTLAALFAAALLASALIRVDRVRLVPAVAQGAQVRAAAAPGLRPGIRATFANTATGARVGVRVIRVDTQRVLAQTDAPVPGGAGVLELKDGDRPLIAQLVPGSQR
jgi:hypothetical protein